MKMFGFGVLLFVGKLLVNVKLLLKYPETLEVALAGGATRFVSIFMTIWATPCKNVLLLLHCLFR